MCLLYSKTQMNRFGNVFKQTELSASSLWGQGGGEYKYIYDQLARGHGRYSSKSTLILEYLSFLLFLLELRNYLLLSTAAFETATIFTLRYNGNNLR